MNAALRRVAVALAHIAFAALWFVAPEARSEVAARGRLLGTGSDEHVWWIDPRADGAYVMHASARSPTPLRVELARYDETPDAIAAFGDRVWLSFPPTADRPTRRDVITFATSESAATGLAYAEPRGGADLVASLPTNGELVGFAADARGPYALLQAAPGPRFGVRREGGSQSAVDSRTQLLRLDGNAWVPIDLPEGAVSASSLALVRYGDRIAVVAGRPDGSSLVMRRDDGGWTSEAIAAPLAAAAWCNAAGRVAVGVLEGSEVRTAYLRDRALVPWARLAVPGAPWLLAGDAHGAVVVSGSSGTYQRRLLGAIDAQAGPIETLAVPGFRSGAWIHVPILGAIAIAGIMAVVFLRSVPRSGEEDALAGPPPLALERRAMALLIDFLPGALIAIVAMSAAPDELLALPSWSLDLATAEPSLVAIAVTCLHGAIGEYFVGRSIGKAVVGGVVVGMDGSPANGRQTLVRAFFKFVTLCAPILGCFVFFAQSNRSLGDMLANTIVADAHDRPDGGAGPHESERRGQD
ncbi:MAG: RDD family protein [Phycisphaerales bacterium]